MVPRCSRALVRPVLVWWVLQEDWLWVKLLAFWLPHASGTQMGQIPVPSPLFMKL